MNRWRINPGALRTLREHAGVRSANAMADLVGYHVRHYLRFESDADWAAGFLASTDLVDTIAEVLSRHLRRKVDRGEFAARVTSRHLRPGTGRTDTGSAA